MGRRDRDEGGGSGCLGRWRRVWMRTFWAVGWERKSGILMSGVMVYRSSRDYDLTPGRNVTSEGRSARLRFSQMK